MAESRGRWAGLPPLTYVAGVALVLAAVVGLLAVARVVQQVFFLTFLGALIASLLNLPISFLARYVRRGIATLIVLLAVFSGLATAVYYAAPALVDQGRKLAEQAPAAIDKAERMLKRVVNRSPIEDIADPEDLQLQNTLRDRLKAEAGSIIQAVLPVATGIASVLSAFLLLLVVGFFLAWEPASYADGLVMLVPKHREEEVRLWLHALGHTIQLWMFATLMSMTFVGVTTAIGLAAIGIKSWLVLSVLNFFAEFVPYVGPLAGSVPGLAIGFAQGTRVGFYTLLVYIGVQQLEAYLVQPIIMKRQVKLNPVVLILWQVLMGGAFGVLGIFIATPLLACIKVTVDFWYIDRTLGKEAPVPA